MWKEQYGTYNTCIYIENREGLSFIQCLHGQVCGILYFGKGMHGNIILPNARNYFRNSITLYHTTTILFFNSFQSAKSVYKTTQPLALIRQPPIKWLHVCFSIYAAHKEKNTQKKIFQNVIYVACGGFVDFP